MDGTVLLVTADYPPMPGGQARFLGELWTRFPEESAVVLAPGRPGPAGAAPAPSPPGPRTIRARLPLGGSRVSKGLKAALLSVHCARLCLSVRPRILCGGQATAGGIAAWSARRLLGVPYAVVAYGGDILGWPGPRRLLAAVLGEASLIVCISDFARSQALRVLGSRRVPVELLHPPLPARFLRPLPPRDEARRALGLDGGDLVILTVARLIPRKGVGLVLELLPDLRRRHSRLRYLVAGEGPERASLEARAAELGVGDCVRFLGFVPEEGLAALYTASDLFVLAAQTSSADAEGFGIVCLEAQAAGLPVVAFRSGGVPDTVEEGATALLAPPGDVRGLAGALDALAADPARRARLGERGRAWAKERFDPDRQAAAFWNLLRSLA